MYTTTSKRVEKGGIQENSEMKAIQELPGYKEKSNNNCKISLPAPVLPCSAFQSIIQYQFLNSELFFYPLCCDVIMSRLDGYGHHKALGQSAESPQIQRGKKINKEITVALRYSVTKTQLFMCAGNLTLFQPKLSRLCHVIYYHSDKKYSCLFSVGIGLIDFTKN